MVRQVRGVAGERRQRRLSRLREELVDAQAAFPVTGVAGDLLVDEIDYARFPRVHENRVPTYGCLIPLGGEVVPVEGAITVGLDDAPIGLARPFADGASSFLVRGRSLGLLCSSNRLDDEAGLVALAAAADAYVVQRTSEGHVKVLSFGAVTTWQGVEWQHKPRADRSSSALAERLGAVDRAVVDGLLALCLHWLSPARCGAIVVWLRSGGDGSGTERPARPVPPLHVTERAHYPALVSVLRQTDGAALLAPDGRLEGYGVGLLTSEAARRAVAPQPGRRHTAARRYSYDHPGAVVFVTSEDGPVSVYEAGETVLHVGAAHAGPPEGPVREDSGRTTTPRDLPTSPVTVRGQR